MSLIKFDYCLKNEEEVKTSQSNPLEYYIYIQQSIYNHLFIIRGIPDNDFYLKNIIYEYRYRKTFAFYD